MKANLKNAPDVELNCDYLKTVGSMYTYFYIPESALSADLLNSVWKDSPITNVDRCNDGNWQVQVKTEEIAWED